MTDEHKPHPHLIVLEGSIETEDVGGAEPIARVSWAASVAAAATAAAHEASERASIGAGSSGSVDELDELDEYDRTVLYPPGTPRRTVYSATRPNFMIGALQDRLDELATVLRDVTTDLEGTRELWDEYDDHCQNWRFSPEELTAELVCVALSEQIRAYCAEHPLQHTGTLNRWNYEHVSDEWADAFWQWLITHPIGERMIMRSESLSMCFLTSGAQSSSRGERHSLMYLRYIHARCIEWVCELHDRDRHFFARASAAAPPPTTSDDTTTTQTIEPPL